MSPSEEILEDQTSIIQRGFKKLENKGLPGGQNPFSTKRTISELKFYEQWPFKNNNIANTYW